MLRIERGPGTLTLVSRFARTRPLAILVAALVLLALAARRDLPLVAVALALTAVLFVVAGARPMRAVLARGRVRVSPPVPVARATERPLGAFSAVRVETLAEARRRKAERQAAAYRAKAGSDLPRWLRPGDQPGANDQLRRVVLDGPGQDPLAVTTWLSDDDLEPARAAVAALLLQ